MLDLSANNLYMTVTMTMTMDMTMMAMTMMTMTMTTSIIWLYYWGPMSGPNLPATNPFIYMP